MRLIAMPFKPWAKYQSGESTMIILNHEVSQVHFEPEVKTLWWSNECLSKI